MADVSGLYRRFGVKLPDLGDRWASTRCFTGAHRDRHPSMRVHLTAGTFKCFACGARGGVLDALELLGVKDRGEARRLAVEYGILEPTRQQRPPRPAPLGLHIRPAAPTPKPEPGLGGRVDYDNLPEGPRIAGDRTWVYVDEQNRPVGRVRRLDLADGTKRLWQERPIGDGWQSGLNGAHLPLYRLPLVLRHARAGHRVVIVEGEKAVDALDRVGVFSTTCAQGAGKWRDEHSTSLAGATVQAITDCDLAGRLHAIRLSMDCLLAGVRVLTPVDPEPGRNDGFDIVDQLAAVATTVRAVTPGLGDAAVRGRLHDYLEQLLNRRSLPVDGGELQRLLEHSTFTANPAGHAYIECARCDRRRVHRVTHGYAYCPCGTKRMAP